MAALTWYIWLYISFSACCRCEAPRMAFAIVTIVITIGYRRHQPHNQFLLLTNTLLSAWYSVFLWSHIGSQKINLAPWRAFTPQLRFDLQSWRSNNIFIPSFPSFLARQNTHQLDFDRLSCWDSGVMREGTDMQCDFQCRFLRVKWPLGMARSIGEFQKVAIVDQFAPAVFALSSQCL